MRGDAIDIAFSSSLMAVSRLEWHLSLLSCSLSLDNAFVTRCASSSIFLPYLVCWGQPSGLSALSKFFQVSMNCFIVSCMSLLTRLSTVTSNIEGVLLPIYTCHPIPVRGRRCSNPLSLPYLSRGGCGGRSPLLRSPLQHRTTAPVVTRLATYPAPSPRGRKWIASGRASWRPGVHHSLL